MTNSLPGFPIYRPEIDGLRAIAILSVALFHAGGATFPGGYIGVDIFFVISGFLITSIIKSKIDRNEFSFADFYARRARRILPALFVMLLATSIIFGALLTPNEMKSFATLLRDTILFTANFYLSGEPGYFDARMQDNPLLHVWSLAVEEQFYFLWPPILLLLFRFNHGKRARAAIGLLAGISFALSVYGVWKAPRFAFYHLPPRGFELMAGGALALGITPPVWSQRAAEIAAALGLALLITPVFAYTPQTAFPGFAALPPVLGCALVIWAETSFPTRAGALLRWPPLIFIGLISYSWYLWHWPILCALRIILFRDLTGGDAAIALLFSFGIAVLSWRFVERPFRRHPRLEILSNSRFGRLSPHASLGLSAAAALFIVATLARSDGAPWRWSQADLDRFNPKIPVGGTAAHPVQTIPHASSGNTLYEIRPLDVGSDGIGSFLLWGDSFVGNYAPALRSILGPGTIFWFGGCTPILGVTWFVNSPKPRNPGCSEARQTVIEAIHARRPGLIVLASRWIIYGIDDTLGGALKEDPNDPADRNFSRKLFADKLRKTLQLLTSTGAKVLVMADTPEASFDVPKCRAILSRLHLDMAQCRSVDRKAVEDRLALVNSLLAEASADISGVHVFWPLDSLCDAKVCYLAKGEALYYGDSNHLALDGSMALAARLRETLQGMGLATQQLSADTTSKDVIANGARR